jgi:hypothetical protein
VTACAVTAKAANVQVTCECGCGKVFEAQRRSARFASSTCRKRASRQPKLRSPAQKPSVGRITPVELEPAPPPEEVPEPDSDFVALTREELRQLGRLETMLGQQVLIVARRMSSGAETGSALATLSKEHSRLMAALGAGGKQADPVDEVKRRRDEKRARATAG